MAQDIRKMMRDNEPTKTKLSEGHEARFADKLKANFPQKNKKPTFFWLKIAAAIVAFAAIGYVGYQNFKGETAIDPEFANVEEALDNQEPAITLGDLSPDLKKVEEFYLAGIEVQLASLPSNGDNKELIDGYLKRLEQLNKEYQQLNKELNEVGPTEATITALVDNLKLRLELLFKLKNKLKELKQLENEQFTEMDA
ncbi:MAG: hypothetical protein HKN48_07955 [Flavobacteriaceae bacterium]|nr:hypothetical protein [Flavobacteriaceae bacterium]